MVNLSWSVCLFHLQSVRGRQLCEYNSRAVYLPLSFRVQYQLYCRWKVNLCAWYGYPLFQVLYKTDWLGYIWGCRLVDNLVPVLHHSCQFRYIVCSYCSDIRHSNHCFQETKQSKILAGFLNHILPPNLTIRIRCCIPENWLLHENSFWNKGACDISLWLLLVVLCAD